jgi:multiple sugar transport system permease protein
MSSSIKTFKASARPRPGTRPAWRRNEALVAWLLLLPSLIGLLTFFMIPTLRGFYLSLTDSDLLTRANFVGLANYQKLLRDRQFYSSLGITTTYVLLNIPLQTVLALALATCMARLTRSIVVRGLIFLPYLIPMLMATLIWMTILDYTFGPINGFLAWLGLPKLAFLNRDLIIPSLAWINTWRHVGYVALLFFAGLQTIPRELYEAAALDGASEWRAFWTVTLPLLRPVLVFVLITSVVGSFQVFDSVMVAAVPSGGPGDATRVIFWYITNLAFTRFNMGYAATVAVALFVISMAITLLQLRWFRANQSDLN